MEKNYQNRAIFLDRDGTINMDSDDYIKSIEEVTLISDVDVYLKKLSQLGFSLVVISNQSGIAKGLVKESIVNEINSYISKELKEKKCTIHSFYYCPHHPDDNCKCRKPKPELLIQASKDWGIDLENSWMIGDKSTDILAGKNAGCNTFQIEKNGSLREAFNFIKNRTNA